MTMEHHTHPDQLERYSFWWSELRLVIAALALFLGGVPPLYYVLRGSFAAYNLAHTLLVIAWLVSGVASVYMLYRWNAAKQSVFGGNDTKDVTAFFISVVSGINLGLAGLLGRNPGMSIVANRSIFVLVGLIYLVTAYYLYDRWNKSAKKMF